MKSIRIKQNLLRPIPRAVQQILKKIQNSGYQAYLVGGCVRDLLLKRIPKDWDVVSNAPLDQLKELFPQHSDVGQSFGVLKLPGNVDVAIFRKDGTYSNHRHPDSISIGDIHSDSARRDFTINGFYLKSATPHPELIDLHHGFQDLKAKKIRCIGKAQTRFEEDALRILRAARFAAQLGFKIDPSTAKAMTTQRNSLEKISRERVREEVWKGLDSKNPGLFLEICAKQKLWPIVFGGSMPKTQTLKKIKYNSKGKSNALVILTSLELNTENLRLTNEEKRIKDRFVDYFFNSNPHQQPQVYIDEYNANKDFYLNTIALYKKIAPKEFSKNELAAKLKLLQKYSRKSPIWAQAQELISKGIAPGPSLGEALYRFNWQKFKGTA